MKEFFVNIVKILANSSVKFTNKEIKKFEAMLHNAKLPLNIEVQNEAFPSIKISYKDHFFEIKRSPLERSYFLIIHNTYDILNRTNEEISPLLLETKFICWVNEIKNYHNIIENSYIIKISKDFYSIYHDAIFMENLGSVNSGMLYRKALEYLLLDFIKFYFPNIEIDSNFRTDDIKKQICKILCLDKKHPLMIFITKTFKMGNDFTHYREQIGVDVKKMRNNIELFIELISKNVKQKLDNEDLYKKMN